MRHLTNSWMCKSPNLVGTRELKCTATQMNASMLLTSLLDNSFTLNASHGGEQLHDAIRSHVLPCRSPRNPGTVPVVSKGMMTSCPSMPNSLKTDSGQRPQTLIWLRYINLKSTTACHAPRAFSQLRAFYLLSLFFLILTFTRSLALSLSFFLFLSVAVFLILFSLFSSFLILVFRLDHVVRNKDTLSWTWEKPNHTLRLSNWCLHAYPILSASESESVWATWLTAMSFGRSLPYSLASFSSSLASSLLVIDEQHRCMVETDAVWTEVPSLTFALNMRGFRRS